MFENIQKGDIVLMSKCFYVDHSFGRRKYKTFYIAQEVTRTTKTQFSIGKKRFMKTGHEIGSDLWRRSEGATYIRPINHACGDQTKDYLKFKHETETIKKVIKFCENAAKFLQKEDHERAFSAAEIIGNALETGAKKEAFKQMTGEK